MKSKLFGLAVALLVGLSGCKQRANEQAHVLPSWISQRPGSSENPIGAVAIWTRCPSVQSEFVLGLGQLGPEIARINPALQESRPIDANGRSAGYPAIVSPLTRLFAALARDRFQRLPTKGTYETTADFAKRVEGIRAERDTALATRLAANRYAVVLGSFRIEGMNDVPQFSATAPDTVAYQPDTKKLAPVRDEWFFRDEAKPLGRHEIRLFGQMDPATSYIRVTRQDRTRLVIDNEAAIPLDEVPSMSAGDVKRRHPGLIFVASGVLVGLETDGPDLDTLHLNADRIELRDLCANETLWHSDLSVGAN